ncbi:ATP-binding cassette domain-containing protein [Nakamurella sp. YIM 132087]|uniref:ATP-binding cassette domain-containing protein n=1 Tax=Nakamurella alba TaxID=2665158 RepID=A0A7K1FLZ0_9ACTN|nr:sugar ABC transporter ATP-binding protein [Nakamurella alba]MTD15128.1 ATP-binding cassette domain-containing protein [Nakamurella alba]
MATDEGVLIDARGLSKVFDGVEVLGDADLRVEAGRIHALVGANGSGKSTLIKILSGYHTPTRGTVDMPADPGTGLPAPMAFVHQDLGLVETMSVQENIALACGFATAGGRIKWRTVQAQARDLLTEFGVDVDPEMPIGELGGTERRLVAIARSSHSLGGRRGVLVLDEPTAALPPDEVHQVFELMRVIARRGSGVLFVCHNLVETLAVADDVTVLRNGRVVAQTLAKDTSPELLAQAMFGGAVDAVGKTRKAGHRTDEVGLRLQSISGKRVKELDLAVHVGEVVGVTGLVGCGKSELGRIIAGAQKSTAGTIAVRSSTPQSWRSPDHAMTHGVAYVPPDRRRSGGVLTMQARENVTLSTVDTFFTKGRIDKKAETKSVAAQMVEVGAVPARPQQPFAAFSGGNQQKLVFARVLRLAPKVVVLDDPTQGVDAETIPELYRFIRSMAAQGCAVVVITADIDELVEVCDRVVVLEDGRLVDDIEGNDVTIERIGSAVARGSSAAVTA